eukprot:s2028_g4.t2
MPTFTQAERSRKNTGDGEAGTQTYRALRDIKAGEALSIDYLNFPAGYCPAAARAKALQGWGFSCTCPRCVSLPEVERSFVCPACGEPQLCPSHPSSSEMGCLSCGKAPEARPRMVPFFAALLACFYCNVPHADYVARCLDREAKLAQAHSRSPAEDDDSLQAEDEEESLLGFHHHLVFQALWQEAEQGLPEGEDLPAFQQILEDFYELLEVARDADAEQIKTAVTACDCSRMPPIAPMPRTVEIFQECGRNWACSFQERFKLISEAYQVLSDTEQRAAFNRFGKDGMRGPGNSGHDDSSFGMAGFGPFASFGGFGQGGPGVRVVFTRTGPDGVRYTETRTSTDASTFGAFGRRDPFDLFRDFFSDRSNLFANHAPGFGHCGPSMRGSEEEELQRAIRLSTQTAEEEQQRRLRQFQPDMDDDAALRAALAASRSYAPQDEVPTALVESISSVCRRKEHPAMLGFYHMAALSTHEDLEVQKKYLEHEHCILQQFYPEEAARQDAEIMALVQGNGPMQATGITQKHALSEMD